jgi:PAS domain S-box-containing protein
VTVSAQSALEPDSGTLLGGERKVLELIATGAPLEEILDALCRVIDQQSALRSSIFLLDAAEEHLTLAAGPHLPAVWRAAVAAFPVTITACGAAITRRQQTISADIAADPLYQGFYEVAAAAAIRAVWSTPFFSRHGRPLGTFAVYSDVPGPPSPINLALVGRATHLASIAVERHLTERGLRESEIRFSRAFYANPACMAIWSFADGRFQAVNDAFVRMFGYSRAETVGQSALSLGLYADPRQRPSTVERLLDGTLHEIEVQGRTKSGEILDLIVSMARIELLGEQSVLAIAIDITERKRAEAARRESDERFRQIAEHIDEVFWMSTADFSQMLYVSPGYETIWGRTCESLYQEPRSWMAAIHPDDRSRVIATKRHQGIEVEYRVVRPDGSIRWIRDRAFPIKDDAGRLDRVAGLSEDITERRRVDEQLRNSERLLAGAQRLAHIGSWHWELTSRTVTWSDELYRIFGVDPHDIEPTRDAMAFVHPDDRDAIMRAIDRTMETREPYSFFYRIRRRDGSERTLHSLGYLVSNERGEPVSIVGSTQDVTERKRMEDALRRSEQLLRLVLEAIPVGVIVVDPAGNIILNNPASNRIWGEIIRPGPERYARSQAWWHATGKKVEPDEWASRRALATGQTAINDVLDIEAFDGTRKIIHNSAVPIRDEHQAIIGAVVINEDVSARQAAERDLKTSVRQMQTLATRLMHAQDDERRRIAQMLHETTAQDLAALKMLLARFNRLSDRLSDADRALLAESVQLADRSMSEVRTLAYLLHPPFLEETGLLSALKWYAQGFASRSGIDINLDLPETLARLPHDVEMTLFRVVQEALINIHRHADSATARIGLSIAAGRLTLEIEDHGRGMAPDYVARLMAGIGALGVGLPGMRERLKQIGGGLEIDSSERGTVVRAIVPAHEVAS